MRQLGVVLSVAQSVGSFYCVDVLRRGAIRRARSLAHVLLHADVQARTWQAGRPAGRSVILLHDVGASFRRATECSRVSQAPRLCTVSS